MPRPADPPHAHRSLPPGDPCCEMLPECQRCRLLSQPESSLARWDGVARPHVLQHPCFAQVILKPCPGLETLPVRTYHRRKVCWDP